MNARGGFDFSRHGRVGILFAEDFDDPGVTVLDEPAEPAEPSYGQAELDQVRDTAYAEGVAAGLAQANADRAEITARLLARLTGQLDDARRDVTEIAERGALSLARLLLGCLGQVLPEACLRHGEAEAAAVARAVLPSLEREPKVVVRCSPHVIGGLRAQVARLDGDLSARIVLTATEDIAPGDVRIAWRDGAMTRDTAALWRAVTDALAPLGLCDHPAAPAELEAA